MSQNLVVFAAKAAAGGSALLNLDSAGNLLVKQGADPVSPDVAVSSSSGNVAAASAVATLAAATGKTTYISGFSITGLGATAAGVSLATLAGVLGGTMTFVIPVPVGATIGITPLNVNFNPPLPASAVNTAIVLTVPTFGSGNTNAAANAWGFQK